MDFNQSRGVNSQAVELKTDFFSQFFTICFLKLKIWFFMKNIPLPTAQKMRLKMLDFNDLLCIFKIFLSVYWKATENISHQLHDIYRYVYEYANVAQVFVSYFIWFSMCCTCKFVFIFYTLCGVMYAITQNVYIT